MNSIDMCFWLQGFFELSGTKEVTPEQVEIIKKHLHLVFVHEIDPLRESQTKTPASILNAVHGVGGSTTGNDPRMRC